MNAMDGTNRRSRGVIKAAVAHKRLSSVIADNARDDYASNQIFEDESPFTPALDKAVLRYSRTARKLPAPLQRETDSCPRIVHATHSECALNAKILGHKET